MSPIYTHQLGTATSQHKWTTIFTVHISWKLSTIICSKSVSHKCCMMHLTYLCTLYQDISLSGNVPHYSPTIHVCVCVCASERQIMVLTIYWRLHNIKWHTHAPNNALSWREWGKPWQFGQDRQYPGKVKMSKGELNVQSKCHENKNSSPSLSLL